VKNLLSVVQAVVTRTFSEQRPVKESIELATRRLKALGRTQDLLTQSEWSDLPLREIIDAELSPFVGRIECDGPDLLVGASNVQSFGLLLHELATNAVKYGALRDGQGSVSVRWSIEPHEGGKRFRFSWKEHCTLEQAVAPVRDGFGSTLLRSAFRSPESTCKLEMAPDGLIYELSMPLSAIGRIAGADEGGRRLVLSAVEPPPGTEP
jgi:two-component system CheB/CheR fusion protein